MGNGTEFDDFGDVRGASTGIFGAEQAAIAPGLAAHRKISLTPTAIGLVCDWNCDLCGHATKLIVEWAEVICVKYNLAASMVLPHAGPGLLQGEVSTWSYNRALSSWQPDHVCRCTSRNTPAIAPAEAEHYLVAARSNGWLVSNVRGSYEVPLSNLCVQIGARNPGLLGR